MYQILQYKAAHYLLKIIGSEVTFVITAINFQYCSSGATTIGFMVYYIIAALCRIYLFLSLKQRITSAQYKE